MNKTIITRVIFIVLIIINCIAIFNFSSEDSEKSTKTSGVVVDRVVNTITSVNKKAKKTTLKDDVTFVVRKMAHFTIYMLLGIWLFGFYNTFNQKTKFKILFAIISALIYASTDEFHQSFVSGRSPAIRDVCIDTSGALVGCLIFILILKIIASVNKNKVRRIAVAN